MTRWHDTLSRVCRNEPSSPILNASQHNTSSLVVHPPRASPSARRIVAPMSATEKLINSKLLGKVEKLSATGRVSASDL